MKKENPWHIKVNNWRVFPRIFSIAYLILMFNSLYWAQSLGGNLSAEVAGLVATIITAGAAWFKFYVETGNGSNKNKDL